MSLPTLEGTSSVPICDHCGLSPTFYCQDCDDYYCSIIGEAHKSGRKTQSHKIQNYVVPSLPSSIQQQVVC